jgi:hypothetical protein
MGCFRAFSLLVASLLSFTLLYSFSSVFVYFSLVKFVERTTPKLYFEHPVHYNFSEMKPSCNLVLDHRPEWYQVDDTGVIQIRQVAIGFEIPESPKNIDLGKFSVRLDLVNGSTTFSSQRLVTLRYRSVISRVVSTLFYTIPLLFGVFEEKRYYHVDMLLTRDSMYTLDFNTKLVNSKSIKISISSADVELYSSTIHFFGDVTGYWYYLYQYRFVVSTILLIALFFLELMLIVCIFTSTCFISHRSDDPPVDPKKQLSIKEDSESDDEFILPIVHETMDDGIDGDREIVPVSKPKKRKNKK